MLLNRHIRHAKQLLTLAVVAAVVCAMPSTLSSCGSKGHANNGDSGRGDIIIPVGNAPAQPQGYRELTASFLLPATYDSVFYDINSVQLEAAKQLGIEPISSLKDAYHMRRTIVRVNNCDEFVIDPLTHSVPYLVPEASKLLHDIGRAFKDSVRTRTGRTYRIRTTSLTRTRFSVSNLITVNGNASENSCHCYGTTFDLSWVRFDCQDGGYELDEAALKNLLAEILFKMRDEGRCYVLHERRQSCFHITTRPHSKNSI